MSGNGEGDLKAGFFNKLAVKAREFQGEVQGVLKESVFESTGKITPEEFVAAGDQLIHQYGTWQWASGFAENAKAYLPKDKQFLITRRVPSAMRARDYGGLGEDRDLDGEDSEWLATGGEKKAEQIDSMEDDSCGVSSKMAAVALTPAPAAVAEADDSDEDIPDMDDDDAATVKPIVAAKPAAAAAGCGAAPPVKSGLVRTRTYDISICYDNAFAVPHVYLSGFDENQQPLPMSKIAEDISADHVGKTVTAEAHPHLKVPHTSVHPCKHAEVMMRICAQMREGKKFITVNQYLLLFLKFIASVMPTIEYDYTGNV